MQVLFMLILTYNIYFGSLICEILRFPKLHTVRAFTIFPPKNCVILLIIGLSNGSKRYKCQSYTLLKVLFIHIYIYVILLF
jgi:hypothetical protein